MINTVTRLDTTPLVMIRHGETPWNAAGRIQGSTDIGLGAKGSAEVKSWVVPERFQGFTWSVSPLARARETAELLGVEAPTAEPMIREMDWGEWEGMTLAELRRDHSKVMAETEARGLDFRAPGGESPRQVQDRLRPWLAALAEAGKPTIAVSHKGVIRALLALATGWDMMGRPPVKMDWSSCHLFGLDGRGGVTLEQANISLS